MDDQSSDHRNDDERAEDEKSDATYGSIGRLVPDAQKRRADLIGVLVVVMPKAVMSMMAEATVVTSEATSAAVHGSPFNQACRIRRSKNAPPQSGPAMA